MGDLKVYALDLPGHGKSGGLGEQTISGYAKAVVDWLIGIGKSKAFFVGHSMGGAIAQTLALDHSEHVAGIGLVGTGSKLPVNEDLMAKLALPASFEGAVELIVKWSFGKEADEKLKAQGKEKMLETRPSVLLGDFQACSSFDVRERLAEIKAPACVVCGEEDKMTPLRFSETLAEKIKGAELTTVPEAGHMVMLERPEAVAKAVEVFYKKHFHTG
jgi:pimeloyl-ACP methyl ester carboxylesterase